MIYLDVPVIINKNETTKKEIVYNVNDFPYTKYQQAQRICKKGISYYNISCAFDIETTTIDGIKDNKGNYIKSPYGFMYQWQFCVIDTVCFGRTWEEFLYFLDNLKQGMQLSKKKQLVIYVHNLSYEFQFMKDFLQLKSLFAKDKRKVMKCNTEYFEFRCSYFLSNMNLQKFCENSKLCIHYKLADTYDYKKIRTPKTQLNTKTELPYCYNDVRGLCECIDTKLLDDTILTIPLTNTGYVRREFRQAMKTKENRKQFEKTQLNSEEYKMLRRAFRGGNTHANRKLSNKILYNVYSYDIQSSYPTVMMTDLFPIGKFAKVTIDSQHKLDEYCKKYCCVFDIEFFNIEIKENITIPYIDIAHCQKQSKILNDNGRILKADYITMTITNIDLDIIRETYNFDGFHILNAMFARKGKLPVEFRTTLMKFYKAKTELKGVKGREYEYLKSKNMVNSGYGMTVTAIDHSEIKYDSETQEWEEIKPVIEEALHQYYKSRNNFLCYQWGVFVTANARRHIQNLINIVCNDIVYIDTDSIKFLNKANCKYFEDENEKLKSIAINNDIYASAKDKKCNERYLGIWDFDGFYPQFKTLGAKKYAYYDECNKFHITVSGMNKKKGAKAVGSLDNFNIGTTYSDVGRTVSWYNEADIMQITINDDTFTTASNIGIIETTYTLGITNEYFEVISKYCDFIVDNMFTV